MTVRVDHLFDRPELAACYDALYRDEPRADFAFHLPAALAAQSVLDIGCGTGAFLTQLREAGHRGRLVGIDPARGMIGRARTRTDVEWRLRDASAIRPNERFDFIVMTGHAFQALVEDEAVADLLARVAAALSPTGRLAFETRDPAARAWESWTPDRPRRSRIPNGASFVMRIEVETPFDGRTLGFRHDFVWDEGGVIGTSRSTLRFMGSDVLDEFLSAAGLVVEARFGDWDRSPAGMGGPEIITLARRLT